MYIHLFRGIETPASSFKLMRCGAADAVDRERRWNEVLVACVEDPVFAAAVGALLVSPTAAINKPEKVPLARSLFQRSPPVLAEACVEASRPRATPEMWLL
jgi:hypothetical protein